MLRLIGWLCKVILFTAVVLVLGNWFHWGGKSISDQVKTGMAHAEKNPWISDAKDWATSVTEDVKMGILKNGGKKASRLEVEEVTGSERQKLRALIKELNGKSD